MAWVATVNVPGGSSRDYEQILGEVGVQKGSVFPGGQLVRIASATDSGFQVVSVWETREAFDAFRPRVLAAIQKLGLQQPSIDLSEVDDLATK